MAPRWDVPAPGARSRLRRLSERGRYDRQSIYAILDAAFVCHLGFLSRGQPVVLPTVYGRDGDFLYLHGAPANNALNSADGHDVCVTVTLVDGLVLARSAFHHSVNYRSVVAFGTARGVEDIAQKRAALLAMVDHLLPGRAADARPPTDAELTATKVLRFEIEEASAKVREGGPKEDPEDLALTGIWAGVVPFEVTSGQPIRDDQAPSTAAEPRYLSKLWAGQQV